MCRLYGFRANELTKVECSLAYAQNALLIQSREDEQGVAHADGWGLAHYGRDGLEIEHSAQAAYDSPHFLEAAARAYARTVVAHVRRATVGSPRLHNAHPFRHGRWVFAHNGTVPVFERIEPRLRAESDPDLWALRAGETDSEAVFLWLLSRWRARGHSLEDCCRDRDALVDLLARSIEALADWCRSEGSETTPQLNLVLTDGRDLLASRFGRSLWHLERVGLHDCELCGIPHVSHGDEARYRAAVVASEPISDEAWRELPDATLLSIDARVRVSTQAV